VAAAPIVVVVAPSLGVKSIKDLIALAKAQPGQINFGSSGVGSSTHFAGEQFKLAAGLNVVHVPYKGPSEALLDTSTGRIQYFPSPLVPALPFINDGKLLALGVTTAQRSPTLPDVPTVAEAGLPGYEYQDWWGVFAPAATPRAIVDRISKEIARALKLPDVTDQLRSQGAEARPSTPDEFTSFVRAKIEAARQVAASAGHSGLVRDAARGPFRGCPGRTMLRFVVCSASSSSRGPLQVIRVEGSRGRPSMKFRYSPKS
jgi:tripartite-type tricarboxylate transporter receptor subunit TctC